MNSELDNTIRNMDKDLNYIRDVAKALEYTTILLKVKRVISNLAHLHAQSIHNNNEK